MWQNEISYKLNIIAEGVNGSHDTSPCFWELHHSRKAWSMGVCLRGKSGSLAMLPAIQQKARRQFGIVQFIAHLKAV